jgi:hypothetical protein
MQLQWLLEYDLISTLEKSGENERLRYGTAIRPSYGFNSKNAGI